MPGARRLRQRLFHPIVGAGEGVGPPHRPHDDILAPSNRPIPGISFSSRISSSGRVLRSKSKAPCRMRSACIQMVLARAPVMQSSPTPPLLIIIAARVPKNSLFSDMHMEDGETMRMMTDRSRAGFEPDASSAMGLRRSRAGSDVLSCHVLCDAEKCQSPGSSPGFARITARGCPFHDTRPLRPVNHSGQNFCRFEIPSPAALSRCGSRGTPRGGRTR